MSDRYDLLINERTGKCRAVSPDGKPLTGWCGDPMRVVEIMRRRQPPG